MRYTCSFFLFWVLFPIFGLSQSYQLTVVNGYGSGMYNEGDTVYIWSNPDFNDQVFENWSGSATSYMVEGNEWVTRITIPIGTGITSISATANHNDLASLAPTVTDLITLPGQDAGNIVPVSKEVHYRVPPNPKGMVFCFHGTNGSGLGFTNDIEKEAFFKSGALRNYIMIATDCNEKTFGDQNGNGVKRWLISDAETDDASNNIDIKMTNALRDTMLNRLSLSNDLPTFAMGVSNGANFSDLCAAALGFEASGHMTGNGHPDIYAVRSDATPVIFVQSENDQHSSANDSIVLSNYNALVNRNIDTEFHWHRKTPVYKHRFTRNADMLVTPQTSDSIYQRMVNTNGLLGTNNILLITDNSGLPSGLFDGLGLASGTITDCENQIKIMNADHKFHSHYNNRIIDFFDSHIPIPTQINGQLKASTPKIYPNPTNGQISIENFEGKIGIYNSIGSLVYLSHTGFLNIESFKTGIYYVRFNYNNGRVQTSKIIKE